MTDKLLNYKENKLVFLDIESASGEKNIDVNSDLFKAFQWKMRDKETDVLPSVEETKRLYEQKAALFAPYGQVVCVTIGIIVDGAIVLKTFSGEEKKLLKEFVYTLNSMRGFTPVAWNASFDFPYLRKRFFINGLEDYLRKDVGNDSGLKPWEVSILDLMVEWKGISFNNEGMDEVAIAMGLSSPKDDIKGSDVSKVYHEGGIDRIIKYNQKDVITLINLFRKFTYQTELTSIIIRDEKKNTEVISKIPLMEAIMLEGTVSKKNEGKLLKLISGMSEREKEITIEILETALKTTEVDLILIDKIKKA